MNLLINKLNKLNKNNLPINIIDVAILIILYTSINNSANNLIIDYLQLIYIIHITIYINILIQ